MFSQSESIHARSWVPLQDSPAIRFTYDAHVKAPKDVRVVMSAINDAKHPLDGDFTFDQPHPIPSYLLAIAAGDHRGEGNRSAFGRLCGAVGGRQGRARIRGHREADRRHRAAVRPVCLGPLRHPGAAAVVPVRRHGKPEHDVRHADRAGRRQEPGLAGLARAGALVVGQPGDQRRLARHLAQRGFHHLRAGPHHRGGVRQGAGRRGGAAVRPCLAEEHRRDGRRIRRSWRPIRVASAPTMRCPTWPTTRARGSCARWSSASAAPRSTTTSRVTSPTSPGRASPPSRCSTT